MSRLFLITLIVLMPALSHAQLGGILRRTKEKISQKVNDRVDKKIDRSIDNNLDKIENGINPGQKKEEVVNSGDQVDVSRPKTSDNKQSPALTLYSKFDFVAGESIIYHNDFSSDALGELPIGWNSNGNGEVVEINGLTGKWVQLFRNAFYLTDNTAFFTENFTIEFDLLIRRSNPASSFPQLGFGIMAVPKDSTTNSFYLRQYSKHFAAELKVQPSDYNGSHMHYESFEGGNRFLETEVKRYPQLEKLFNTPIHISIQAQKTRLRIWFNETKMYDLPRAIKEGVSLNQFFLFVKGNGGDESEVGYDISSIKIAKGRADTRHKLMDEGRFSTTGILFDVNSANIKPESFGALKEIADVLIQFPNIRVKVIGHTDSDGSDAANMELSLRRAEAVKKTISSEFAIDSNRIEFTGKGESEPVADNSNKVGKAQNRRVEFIKM